MRGWRVLSALRSLGFKESQAGAKAQAGDEAQAQGLLLLPMVKGAVHGAHLDRVSVVAHPAQRVAVCDLHVGDRAQGIQPGQNCPAPCQRVCSTSGHRIPKSERSELSTRPRFCQSTAEGSPAPEAHAPVNGPAPARRAASPQTQPTLPHTSAAGSAFGPKRSGLRH